MTLQLINKNSTLDITKNLENLMIGEWTRMIECIRKYWKEYRRVLLASILFAAVLSLVLSVKIGLKNSVVLFAVLIFLVFNVYLIYKDKRKSIILFLLLLPIYVTARKVCYFNILFVRVTFETIFITILSLSSMRDILNTVRRLFKSKDASSFNYLFLLIAFFVFCINSSFYSVDIWTSLGEVYIGVLTPVLLMLCFITYFNKDDKYMIYYTIITALDFSCLYGFVQLFGSGITPAAINANRALLTFGYNNVDIFAGILISVFPMLTEMIFYKENSKKEKIFLYISFALYSISSVITFSRGAWLCYIIVIFLTLCSRKYKKLLLMLLIPAVFIAKPALEYILHRGTTTSLLNNESTVARIQSIFTDILIMKKYPFGIGGLQFETAYKKFSLQGYFLMPESIRLNATAAHYYLEHAHNLLLQIGVEFGIISAVIFVVIIINRLRRAAKNVSYNKGAIDSIVIFSIFSLITGTQFNHKGIITGTLILFIVFGIIQLSEKKEKLESKK